MTHKKAGQWGNQQLRFDYENQLLMQAGDASWRGLLQALTELDAMESQILARIESWLASHRPEYWTLLNPPAREYLFGALRSTSGIVLPDNVKRFYEWHDGQKAGTFESLLLNLTFMTLMEIATIHQMHQQVAVIDQWSEDHWQSFWIPFLSNGGGDYLCIATESFRNVPAGAVLWYDHEVSDREVVHKDFEAFLEDLYERMVTNRLEIE